ncbi:hypothetical protein RRSWK_03742 [Rhodopirellula sp. SWK7]|nr:hypothetical protein RRSWK_03742 [Rhodopirellula sp. SWK7]
MGRFCIGDHSFIAHCESLDTETRDTDACNRQFSECLHHDVYPWFGDQIRLASGTNAVSSYKFVLDNRARNRPNQHPITPYFVISSD